MRGVGLCHAFFYCVNNFIYGGRRDEKKSNELILGNVYVVFDD